MGKRYPQVILGTACVPWTEKFELDEDAFRQNILLMLKNGVRNIYLFGTAGEGYAVNREQYVRIVKAFLNEMSHNGDAQPMICLLYTSPSPRDS